MGDTSDWIPVIGTLLGAIAGAFIAFGTEWGREWATRRREHRDQRLADLRAFEEAAEEVIKATDNALMSLWVRGSPGDDPVELGAELQTARLAAKRIRDPQLERALDDLRKTFGGLWMKFVRDEEARLANKDETERTLAYFASTDPDVLGTKAFVVTERVRAIRDALDPLPDKRAEDDDAPGYGYRISPRTTPPTETGPDAQQRLEKALQRTGEVRSGLVKIVGIDERLRVTVKVKGREDRHAEGLAQRVISGAWPDAFGRPAPPLWVEGWSEGT